jgi:hypothetical protein
MHLISFYILGNPVKSNWQIFIYCMYAIGLFWVVASARFQMDHTNIKSLFSEGFKAFIVVTFVSTFFTFIFYKFNPQICEIGIAENNLMLMKQGNKTPVEIAENNNQFRTIFIPMMLATNIFIHLVIGAVTSMFCAGILSKRK